jgi:hypothetical protein
MVLASDLTDHENKLAQDWIVILSEFWRETDWGEFPDKKRRSATFEERLEAASNAGSVHGAFKKLAHGLNMASPDLPTEHLDPLVADSDLAMEILRKEDIWLTAKTRETVQNYFEAKQNSDTDAESNPTTSELSDFITED